MRQSDLAEKAEVAQSTISLVERGHADTLALTTLTAIAAVVDARVRLTLSWRGGDLDRLTDARHAALATQVAGIPRASRWLVQAEVTFSFGTERGSIDLLAWSPSSRTLLVVEIKTILTSTEAMLRTLDMKVRRAPAIASRFGWRPLVTGRLIVLPATRTNRRHVDTLSDLVGPELVIRAWTIRRWIRAPSGDLNAAWMLTTSSADGTDRDPGGFQRVRLPCKRPTGSDPRSAEATTTDPVEPTAIRASDGAG